jgi:fatty-acid desaturase
MSTDVEIAEEKLTANAEESVATLPVEEAVDLPQNRRLEIPEGAQGQKINWGYAVPIFVIHVFALSVFVPWLFSWTGVAVFLFGAYFYGVLGIDLCYHRLLTHRSLVVPKWLERTFTTIAICSFEDAPATWVAAHRLHHKDSDHQPDPHSPLVSFLWSHIGWLLIENPKLRHISVYERYARDILKDRYYLWLARPTSSLIIYLAHAALYYFLGAAAGWLYYGTLMGGVQLGLSVLVWGVFARTVYVWHISWSVNSLTHLFGYRTYETNENSRNNWFVAALTSGEGWHNNHHADQASASNWHRWWEIDLVYIVIRGLEMVGLAKDVIRPRHQRR